DQPVAPQRRFLGAPHPALAVDDRGSVGDGAHGLRRQVQADRGAAMPAAVRFERGEVVADRTGEGAHGPYGVTVQLLMVRHGLPLRSEPGQGSDPDLSQVGLEQARRLPVALARFPVTRLVSSPQRSARQTAAPVADALGLAVEVDDRLAEYDRDMPEYVPIEQMPTDA